MTALPTAAAFTGASVSEGDFKTALTDLRSYLASLLGTTGNVVDALATLLVAQQVLPISASVASNILTITLSPCVLQFRSTTPKSGAVVLRQVASPVTLTVPVGASLGTANGLPARLAVLAQDNAGTVEVAAVNTASGLLLDETGLISTTAISSGATSASTIYSTTARSNLAYRHLGFLDITEAVAGTWATDPTLVQGMGGRALVAKPNMGVQLFTSAGNFTVPAGVTSIEVTVVGGGGGGAGGYVFDGPSSSGGSGGAGGYGAGILTGLTAGAVIAVTVGAAGSASAYNTLAPGGSGGTSSFGAFISATGGGGGGAASVTNGSVGATGSAGAASGSAVIANYRSGGGTTGNHGLGGGGGYSYSAGVAGGGGYVLVKW